MVSLVFDPIYSQLELPQKHRFPIEKYAAIQQQLIANKVKPTQFIKPNAVRIADLKQVYDPNYIDQLTTGRLSHKAMRRIGFEWSPQLIKRTLTAVGGTLLTANLALENGKALNLTGGYHHAFANFGSGFCMINDLYLSALNMLQHPNIDKVLIFDCDVHQGDGTAKLASNNDRVYTVSIHGEKNFPHRKQLSDLDIGLAKGTQDEEYLEAVEQALDMAINYSSPDAVIYDAGVDVHINDDLGHLEISTNGVYKRDKLVIDKCETLGLPVACVIGGGYQRNINALVDVHLQLFKAAQVF